MRQCAAQFAQLQKLRVHNFHEHIILIVFLMKNWDWLGYSASNHVLSVFGGAGPQHGCAIARNLGMKKVT